MNRNKKTNLGFVQPIITSYRTSLIEELAENYDLTVYAGENASSSGFYDQDEPAIYIVTKIKKMCFFGQVYFLRGFWLKNHDVIICYANLFNIFMWLLSIKGFFSPRLKVILYGQGLYRHEKKGLIIHLHHLFVTLSAKYVCSYP